MKLKVGLKCWYNNLPAIIKEVTDNEIVVYVFYTNGDYTNGFWIEDVCSPSSLRERFENISQKLFEIRKGIADDK